MLRWYLIHTKPSGETLAHTNLDRQGYEVYLPRALQTVRHSGRLQERIVPLFPRYLFLHLKEGLQALSPVQFTLGVAGVVRFGSRYTVVPEKVVRDLQVRADPVSGLHRLTQRSRLIAGARIEIRTGIFDGLEGVFEREAGADRVVVLLRLLGQNVSACVPVDCVLHGQAL